MNLTERISLKPLHQGLLLGLLAVFAVPAQAQVWWSTSGSQSTISDVTMDGMTINDPYIILMSTNTSVGPITTDGTYLYWSDQGAGTLGRATLSTTPGAGPTNVSEGWITNGAIGNPWGISTDGVSLYWADFTTGYIGMATLPTGGGTTPSAVNPTFYLPPVGLGAGAPEEVCVDSTYIFWADTTGSVIYRVTKTLAGTVNDDSAALISGCNGVSSLYVTPGGDLYWTNFSNNTLGHCASADGTPSSVTQNFYTGTTNPEAICVANNIYWAGDFGLFEAPVTPGTSNNLVADGTTLSPSGTDYVGITVLNDNPTVITLVSFTAKAQASQVALAWQTGSEVNTVGFNLWRSGLPNGTYTQLNASIIPATGTNVSGASYAYNDTTAASGQTYYYKLEDLDTAGVATYHGPVSVGVGITSPIQSFTATPSTIFMGGGATLAWSVTGTPALTVTGLGSVAGTSAWVTPGASTQYTLADTHGDTSLASVTVKHFTLQDMAGLSKAWGSVKGGANYNPCYDLNGDGKVDDTDVALCFASLQ